jgi:uncharacterized RDD family membrane protein YckC
VTEEDRNIVTPFAFRVSDSLLGMPLASPSKRLFAILIDMILIALLTTLSSTIFAGLMAVTAFVGSMNLRKQDNRTVAAGVLLVTSILCALIAVGTALYDGSGVQMLIGEDTGTSVQEIQADAADEISNDEPTLNETDSPEESDSPGLIAWVQGVVTDLGLSFGWSALYFTLLVAWQSGQTIGKRVLGIQVISIDGHRLSLWDSFGRYGGYGAGLATGLLGFFQIYWDPNRQAIQDKISETLVVDLRKSPAEGAQLNKRLHE